MSAPTKAATYAMQTWLFHAIVQVQPRYTIHRTLLIPQMKMLHTGPVICADFV